MTTVTPVKQEEAVLPSPASEVGLAGLSMVDSATSCEAGKGADVVQITQISSKGPLEKPKEAAKEKRSAPSPV